ncbi:hypothetical protein TI39_contig282g00021 [Zymoseptoria brevis]|uniref:Uncharacterized protein n=1 Tax=Zymoseptoria brevis TaxID=1047168 RepID=A0A0F4GWB7_9PEZI|nr:hypothetical protein TI39_contig282g00021 [Zymoseptoria brevis]
MAQTRSSQGDDKSSSPSAGTKRKVEDSTAADDSNPKSEKQQKTLEETLSTTNGHSEAKDSKDNSRDNAKDNAKDESKGEPQAAEKSTPQAKNGDNAFDQVKADENDAGSTSKKEDDDNNAEANASNGDSKANGGEEKIKDTNGGAVEESKDREEAMPSNILEKGIIYFFSRGRVQVDNPDSVQDLARSYFVLRPLPDGAKLTDGAIQDVKNNRLIALPKKVWPKSGKDRFMAFVEKAKVGMDTLKEEFFSGSDYSTKTTGTRHTPEVTPMGEGVYAMTSTGGGQGTTHLAYMLTIPSEIGEVQKDLGISQKGSFVLSLKNPESKGPANAQLDKGAEYPSEIMEEFRGRSWMPVQAKHLDYDNAQMLLIGEDFESSSNLEPAPKDEKNGEKETPQEELEKLEEEDEHRVEHLKGDDTIFADLGISSKDYPKVPTTW